MKVDYENMTVTDNGSPGKDAMKNYYRLLINYHIGIYGRKVVMDGLKGFIEEHQQ